VTGKYPQLSVSDKRTRTLALLLLAAIAWGATAEVTHHHSQSGRSSAQQLAAAGDPVSSERIDSPSNRTSSNRTSTRDECLICQLQQNLFATIFSPALQTTPATTATSCTHVAEIPYSSQSKTPQKGRAPPFNL
jgi:hypothetical protein